jgi:hypothetical protein
MRAIRGDRRIHPAWHARFWPPCYALRTKLMTSIDATHAAFEIDPSNARLIPQEIFIVKTPFWVMVASPYRLLHYSQILCRGSPAIR